MIPLTLAEVAAAVDGRLVGADPDAVVSGPVEYDSRRVAPGGLFVAFPGERVDGHHYAAGAVAAGAVAVLGTRLVEGVPMVLVTDGLTALAALARALLDRLPEVTVIGLTGSSGKTTTKDLIGQLVSRLGPTVAPPGSPNNELGHPYTVLQADEHTRYLVLEKGARGVGHIRFLCGIARPRIAAVLNVGVAHIGEFGSREAIAAAKGELVEALPPDGLAVLNADDPLVRAMADRTSARVVLVGEAADAQVRACDARPDGRGRYGYTLVTPEGQVPVQLGLTGAHQVGNSLLAAAVARELGMPLAELGPALGELGVRSTRRMDVFDRTDGVTVIDDSYNANPASTAAALHALAGLGAGRRTVAVLGYMAELGPYERDGHAEVGRLAAELDIDRVLVVGEAAAPIHEGARSVATWGGTSVLVTDQPAAVGELRRELRSGDVVLVKGSRYRTWEVVDALRPGAADGIPPVDPTRAAGAAAQETIPTEGEPA
ncbi:UDP-N-acetylmuramoyl-tripeptide--D-alanyl-D-alanine ligase [Plantactinospora sp. KBS50]|uniref:UDP-N-acetylmuramoyl-tripeptide--D-alanyl-D- alanine ligase n=1 Tax=Plantactinospora sp. KBS50 TaxID=2024580 RepID=UPI000BAAE036|nr:UDP-N-acetylmuramoyl-tripeptide--D-alanyl-D-alanine ligase [Plantactinospora sp. KBS50]ASW56026.1 UDP-N-acetylmuramoyl-tripeptide--D-alanyl-D-alanine ligase [Plantactinospora sp. KBS50]